MRLKYVWGDDFYGEIARFNQRQYQRRLRFWGLTLGKVGFGMLRLDKVQDRFVAAEARAPEET